MRSQADIPTDPRPKIELLLLLQLRPLLGHPDTSLHNLDSYLVRLTEGLC